MEHCQNRSLADDGAELLPLDSSERHHVCIHPAAVEDRLHEHRIRVLGRLLLVGGT